MKIKSRLLSMGLSAAMILTAASFTAGAAAPADCNNVGVIMASCPNVQSVIDGLCKNGNCTDVQTVLEGLCSDGSCDMGQLIKALNNTDGCTDCADQTVTDTSKPAPSLPVTEVPAVQKDEPAGEDKTSAPANAVSDAGYNTAYEDEVIRLVNTERAKYGLADLQKDEGAASVAHLRAKEIVTSFSHTRPNGSSCFTAANELGVTYSTAGENIAYGYADPAQVVSGWMNSEGHRKNILSSSYSKIGVGCYTTGGVLYWSQFFIG